MFVQRASDGRDRLRVITSASDLKAASECEFAFLRLLDAKLGRIQAVEEPADPIRERAGYMGELHEQRVLEEYRHRFGAGVVEIDRPDVHDLADLEAKAVQTRKAFLDRADVVYQGTFWDGGFVGFADFIVHRGDGIYEVQDAKVARSAKDAAFWQVAAYAQQLERLNVTVAPEATLILGNGTRHTVLLDEAFPILRERQRRLAQIVAERLEDAHPVAWNDERYDLCGRCATCDLEVQANRDVKLVYSLSKPQRAKLRAVGVTTIDELAAADGAVPGIGSGTLDKLRQQARAQLQTEVNGGALAVHVVDPCLLGSLPAPDPGDVFFDFEGDPNYTEGDGLDWNVDYLFGLIEADTRRYVPFWAHDFAQEGQAFRDFLAYLAERATRYPDMHVYHYASYEKTHLKSLAVRHGFGAEQIDDLIDRDVLVDLLPVVTKGLRIGTRSYSLKKLEPLYMGEDERDGSVTTAGGSVAAYVRARELAAEGERGDARAAAEAQRMLDDIADYNEYDCLSTWRLRDWLLELAKGPSMASTPSRR